MGNLTEFSNNLARVQDKNVDDVISEAKTSNNGTARLENFQEDSY